MKSRLLPAVLLTLLAAGCRSGLEPPEGLHSGTVEHEVTVSPEARRQVIDGFGGSNAWTGLPTDAAARARVLNLLFSTTEGAGLSLIRNRVPFRESTTYDDQFLAKAAQRYVSETTSFPGHRTFTLNWNNWDLANTRALFTAARAAAGPAASELRGFSTPWTPPNNAYDLWKKDGAGNTVGGTMGTVETWPDIGGELDPAHYGDYADVLADYARGFEANMGYPLAALSLQNEPDYLPRTYESAAWSGAQFHAFLPSLASAFAAKGVTTPVLLGESFRFSDSLAAASLADPATRDLVSIVGVHQYDGPAVWLSATKNAGKKLWMTEVSDGGANDPGMTDALVWGKLIHDDLTVAEVNAFCYWWLWTNGGSATKGSLLHVNGATVVENKRLFVLGQYSRFVRPGWVRLDSSTGPLRTSVFRSPDGREFAVVIVNPDGATSVGVSVAGGTVEEASLYETSADEGLSLMGELAVIDGKLAVPVAARSVSTVVGRWNP